MTMVHNFAPEFDRPYGTEVQTLIETEQLPPQVLENRDEEPFARLAVSGFAAMRDGLRSTSLTKNAIASLARDMANGDPDTRSEIMRALRLTPPATELVLAGAATLAVASEFVRLSPKLQAGRTFSPDEQAWSGLSVERQLPVSVGARELTGRTLGRIGMNGVWTPVRDIFVAYSQSERVAQRVYFHAEHAEHLGGPVTVRAGEIVLEDIPSPRHTSRPTSKLGVATASVRGAHIHVSPVSTGDMFTWAQALSRISLARA